MTSPSKQQYRAKKAVQNIQGRLLFWRELLRFIDTSPEQARSRILDRIKIAEVEEERLTKGEPPMTMTERNKMLEDLQGAK